VNSESDIPADPTEEKEVTSEPEENSQTADQEQEEVTETKETKPIAETEDGLPENIRRTDSGIPLRLRMVTISSPSFYPAVAEMLKKQWEQVGIYTTVEVLDQEEFAEKAIMNKDYDLLLYGQNLGYNLDAFPFWHFSQAEEGFNLSNYKNFEAGVLLEEIRQTHDDELREKKLAELRDIIKNDAPAVFLFSPLYTMPINPKVQSLKIDHIALLPDRFSDIEWWYIRKSRSFHPQKNWFSFFPWFVDSVKNTFTFS
jgi:ABC-type oligopeptide transport system substrate-binding subunit